MQRPDGFTLEEVLFVPIRNAEALKPLERAQHLVWMIREAQSFLVVGKLDKAQRWLGFVQGALWGLTWASVGEMKRINMPEGETFDPEKI